MTEDKAVALADQAVIDAQGGGQIKDLAGVQRGSAALEALHELLLVLQHDVQPHARSVGRTDFNKPKEVALLAADMALLYFIPALLGTLLKAALKGDWDDWNKLLRKMIADQLNYLLGTVVVMREAGSAVRRPRSAARGRLHRPGERALLRRGGEARQADGAGRSRRAVLEGAEQHPARSSTTRPGRSTRPPNATPGGTVTMLVAPALLEKLTLVSNVPDLQSMNLTNAGAFFPGNINDAVDRRTIVSHQIKEQLDRTFRAPVSDGTAISDFPTALSRANKLLSFDASGNPTVTPIAAGAQGPLVITTTIASIGNTYRTDTGMEVQGADAGVSLFQSSTAANKECFLVAGYPDSNSAKVKSISLSGKPIDATAGTGYGVMRLNAAYNGGAADDIFLRGFGGHGCVFYGSSDADIPGDKIVLMRGYQQIKYSVVISGNFSASAQIENTAGTRGIVLGHDTSAAFVGIIAPSQGPANQLAFWINDSGAVWAEAARIDSNRNLLVGVASTATNSHVLKKASATAGGSEIMRLLDGNADNSGIHHSFCAGDNSGFNGAVTCEYIGKVTSTGRSINAAGTLNAAGADYAEYEIKADRAIVFAKGDIVGFDADGKLTNKFSAALSFGVKSTDPSFVGGDVWGGGLRPDAPIEPTAPFDDSGVEPVRPSQPDFLTLEEANEYTQLVAQFEQQHATWVVEKQKYVQRVTDYAAAKPAYEVAHAAYVAAVAAHEATEEAARQTVDRIAYSGKVPVNVQGVAVGLYIVAVAGPNDSIIGQAVGLKSNVGRTVGRVRKILPDGRAFISVIQD
jgi:hypothetical protein